MAFTQRFKNDLFISYAHADNADSWVTMLEQKLRFRLREFDSDAQFSIWRDERLGGAEVFTDEIYDQLKNSAVLITILSPNGLASDWCEQGIRLIDARRRGIVHRNSVETASMGKSQSKVWRAGVTIKVSKVP